MNGDELPDDCVEAICAAVSSFPGRLSSRRAIRLAAGYAGADQRTARRVINHLVASGRLRFVNDCGVSFLEKNFIGSHRISPRVVVSTLAVPEETIPGHFKTAVVRLMPGAAFGDCRHPTTRLSIKALDAAIYGSGQALGLDTALDIGTGSGILAVTAARLGVKRVVAVDIDQCARKEARDNIAINGLDNVIQVFDMPIPAQPETFSIIMANLRPLTLKHLAALIAERTCYNGLIVLSGMKTDETAGVIDKYRNAFKCVREEAEAGWCGLVLKKRKEVSYGI